MRNNIYLAAFLHDIGEFMNMGLSEEERKPHEILSAEVIDRLKFVSHEDKNIIKSMILNHHEPKDKNDYIIRISDELSCKEGKYIEDFRNMEIKPLKSIFQDIKRRSNGITEEYGYDISALNYENIFPKEINNINIDRTVFARHWDEFMEEFELVDNENQLYYLLEKYLWSIPVIDEDGKYDVSIFEHSKNAAAIALCLYEQFKDNTLEELRESIESDTNQFILINGDISGIQNFLTNITSKGAAKALKANSVYLNLLSDVVVEYLLNRLGLKKANLLYNGGGSFFILAPNNKVEKMEFLKEDVISNILKGHNGEIFYAIDYIEIAAREFIEFVNLWQRAVEKTNRQKYRKWSQLDPKEYYKDIFGPLDDGVQEGRHCNLCGREYRFKDEVFRMDDEDIELCSLCNSFIGLTMDMRSAKYFNIREIDIVEKEDLKTYNDIFALFGYDVSFNRHKLPQGQNLLLNNMDFLNGNGNGYKIGAFSLPMDGNRALNFSELAGNSKGDKNILGILKLDVDDLGAIFGFGLEDNRTISRMTSLSRMMALYFEGYINQTIKDKKLQDKIYVVYSGGDDTFLIGSWNYVLDFAIFFREKFREYTCNNRELTFSAGLGIFSRYYPVIRSIGIAEAYLEEAKEFTYHEEDNPNKDKINLMGEVFNWVELSKIIYIADELLYRAIEEMSDDRIKGRSILQKVYRSTLGFEKILEDSNNGKVDNLKFWNLAYYLRDLKHESSKGEKLAERIIEEYRNIVLSNLMNQQREESIRNIMIIPVATRITELKTKESKEVN